MNATAQLTTAERRLYERCVETIGAGMATAAEVFKAIDARALASQVIAGGRLTTMEVAKALAQVKDGQLWRETFASWAEFVRRSLKVTIRRADQLVVMARKGENPSLETLLGSFPVTQGSNPPAWDTAKEGSGDAGAPAEMDTVGQAFDQGESDEAPRKVALGKAKIAQHIAALRKLVGVLTTARDLISMLDAIDDKLAATPELIAA